MEAAHWLPGRRDGVRLLTIDPESGSYAERLFSELPALLEPGDLLVVNDAATLPASFSGHDAGGRDLEARLVAAGPGETFWAALLGAGSWRQRTEDRPPPPPLDTGDPLELGGILARVVERSPISPRLVRLSFEARGDELWAALYRSGRPVQYAHLAADLPLWAVQTVYAARPWAFEMPSAGRPLTWEVMLALRARGVRWASLTHAAGLSATGDPALDAALPLPERYEIPAATVAAVTATRAEGSRVLAVGTTVVRALEGAASGGALQPGPGLTDLRLTPSYRPRLVDGILSGLHAPEESHFQLLGAFVPPRLLEAAWRHAEARGFRSHELGDALLALPGSTGRRRRAMLAG
jgi:S-adenosylmethionine:tRNA ribosyltransferase-isomerase